MKVTLDKFVYAFNMFQESCRKKDCKNCKYALNTCEDVVDDEMHNTSIDISDEVYDLLFSLRDKENK